MAQRSTSTALSPVSNGPICSLRQAQCLWQGRNGSGSSESSGVRNHLPALLDPPAGWQLATPAGLISGPALLGRHAVLFQTRAGPGSAVS